MKLILIFSIILLAEASKQVLENNVKVNNQIDRLKRNPKQIVVTFENQRCDRPLNPPKFLDSEEDGQMIIQKLLKMGELEDVGHMPSHITIIKEECSCKKCTPKINTEPKRNETSAPPRDSQEKPKPPTQEPHLPPLTGRFSSQIESEEYLPSNNKNIWSMDSAELASYNQGSSLDKHMKQSPMLTIASKQWESNPFADYPKFQDNKESNIKEIYTSDHVSAFKTGEDPGWRKAMSYKSSSTYGYPPVLYSFLTSELGAYDKRELDIIDRINSEYDMNYYGDEYEQQVRVRQAILDFLRSKYPIRRLVKKKDPYKKK
ncbi:hypothetical protein DMENIID0001_101660 [Sergentomyia squamirostris]